MYGCDNPPQKIQRLIDGFGEPSYAWPRVLPDGNKRWLLTWQDIGVSVTWEEFPGGTSRLNTLQIKLHDTIWHGREAIFHQVFDVSRPWNGLNA